MKARIRIFTPEQKVRRHEYYLKNKEKQIAAIKERRKLNPEQRKPWGKTYYSKNKERILKSGSEWAKRNRSKRRVIEKRWREKNPHLVERVWRKRITTGKLAEQLHRRRARIRSTTFENCSRLVSLLRELPLCQYCFRLISGKPTIDHIVPLSRGGKHAKGNLVAACKSCNSSKGSKLLPEWRGMEVAA